MSFEFVLVLVALTVVVCVVAFILNAWWTNRERRQIIIRANRQRGSLSQSSRT